jgi:hypothetical protein
MREAILRVLKERFSRDNNIDYLSAFWFFKGCPVEQEAFKAICDVLDFDWEVVKL